MKKYLLFSAICLCFTQLNAQKNGEIHNLRYWTNKPSFDSFPNDITILIRHIDALDTSVLLRFKRSFDIFRGTKINNRNSARWKDSITLTQKNIKKDSLGIRNERFYWKQNTDTSFLYYYLNKELNDYMESLTSLSQEMGFLICTEEPCEMSDIDIGNFLNAYYNMAQSRSLLLAAMDNLERYYLLGGVADSIKDTTYVMMGKVRHVSSNIDTIKQKTSRIDSTTQSIDSILYKTYIPYKSLSKNRTDSIRSKSQDKITTAANTILLDTRKNWWWRSLLGGLVGGLVVGLILKN